jgi:nicotinamidase-related amidase
VNEAKPKLCRREDSVLLVVDIQERLAAAMKPEEREKVIRNTGILLEAAGMLKVPRCFTEQYPRGLGATEPDVLAKMGEFATRFEKTSFSCCGADGFNAVLGNLARKQVVLAGMEAHVCVLQTALELAAGGYEVVVVEDAVCSRTAENRDNAMARLRGAGVTVANTESVVFEWLRGAGDERFRAIAKLVK